ncbi:hypothetical protein PR048_013028, partial [Dryococelus australis]
MSKSGGDIVIAGDGTDLLALIIVFAPSGSDIKMFVPEIKYQVAKVYSRMNNLLFLHTFTGCDTTFALYHKGTNVPFQKVQHSSDVQGRVAIFNKLNASAQQVAEAVMAFIVAMHEGMPHDSIDALWQHLYIKTIQQWGSISLAPGDWEWKLHQGMEVASGFPLPSYNGIRTSACRAVVFRFVGDDGCSNHVSIIGDEDEDMDEAHEEAPVAADSDDDFAGPSP